MAVVLPGKFIYLATMHTASMATAAALKSIPGAFQPKDPMQGFGHHASLAEVRQMCGPTLTGTETVFTCIRNPYDIIVSWYLRNRTHFAVLSRFQNPSFAEFLEVWITKDDLPFTKDRRMFYVAPDAQVVLRYERGVEQEVHSMLRKMPGVPTVRITRENATPGKANWSTYYDEETYALVNEHYRDDIAGFGYSFLWK